MKPHPLPAFALALCLAAGAVPAQTMPAELSPAELLRAGQEDVARDPATLTARLAPRAALVAGGPELGADMPVLWELFSLTATGDIGERYTHDTGQPLLAAEPGTYVLAATLDRATVAEPVTLAEGATATPLLALNAGLLQINPMLEAGGALFTGARIFVTTPDGTTSTHIGPTQVYVPAGDIRIDVAFDGVKMAETVPVAAAQTVLRDYVAEAGVAQVQILSNGAPLPEGAQARIDIFAAEPLADGRLNQITFDFLAERAFSLPPGDYIAQGMLQASFAKVPFSVRLGEIVTVPVPLDNGELVISAPGALSLAIFRLDPAGAAEPEMLYYEWDKTALNYGVPVGEYRVEVLLPSGQIDKPVTVVSGGHYEISFP
jgi:hypothetical protein